MAITLTDGTTTVELPPHLKWVDEYSWNPVEQSAEWSLTGQLIVETAQKQAGRSITLEADVNMGWILRSTVEQLYGWASTPGKQLTLTLRGVQRTVIFRHQDGAIDSELLAYWRDPSPTAPYRLTIRFMEI